MVVREEKVTWAIVDGSLYKRTELVDKLGASWTSSYVSQFIRKATDQDKIGNV